MSEEIIEKSSSNVVPASFVGTLNEPVCRDLQVGFCPRTVNVNIWIDSVRITSLVLIISDFKISDNGRVLPECRK